jgi:hypothetical protein
VGFLQLQASGLLTGAMLAPVPIRGFLHLLPARTQNPLNQATGNPHDTRKSRNQSPPGPGPPNPHRLGSGVTATASWFMLLGSTSVAAPACVGKSLGSRAAGGGAAGGGDGGFTEIGVASMGAREGAGKGCAHTRVRLGRRRLPSALLDCEVGPVAGPPLWGFFLGFLCFSERFLGFCLPFSCWVWSVLTLESGRFWFGSLLYFNHLYVSAFSLVGFSLLEINFGVFKLGSFTILPFQ